MTFISDTYTCTNDYLDILSKQYDVVTKYGPYVSNSINLTEPGDLVWFFNNDLTHCKEHLLKKFILLKGWTFMHSKSWTTKVSPEFVLWPPRPNPRNLLCLSNVRRKCNVKSHHSLRVKQLLQLKTLLYCRFALSKYPIPPCTPICTGWFPTADVASDLLLVNISSVANPNQMNPISDFTYDPNFFLFAGDSLVKKYNLSVPTKESGFIIMTNCFLWRFTNASLTLLRSMQDRIGPQWPMDVHQQDCITHHQLESGHLVYPNKEVKLFS